MRPSRRVAPKDLDLPGVRQAALRKARLRRRRWRRFFLALPAVAALGIAIYFAVPPIRGAIKDWQSRRLAHQAFALIDQKKWNEAAAKARDAFLLYPTEPEAVRAVARLRSRTGQSNTALEWWNRVDEEHRLTTEFGGTSLVMTSFLASVEVEVAQVEAVAGLPSVIQVR